ncbi:DUF2306 domain-containing protein [Roseovarius ramblicola]|uniref:DUF2306 domain-containing protein n=1 Tax=Roseovarius ramblicola TaxID=2022336 RepID=A0ABV5HY17_9RHOB
MTSFDPLFNAPPAIQVHVAAAMLAVVLTPVALWRRRRDRLHRVAGYAWVLGMAVAALSSFAITEFGVVGPFSPIHALSVATLAGLVVGVRAAIRGDVRGHRASMTQLSLALAVAGMFTLAPGRIAHRMVMDGTGWAGFAVVAFLAAAGLVLIRRWRRGRGARA